MFKKSFLGLAFSLFSFYFVSLSYAGVCCGGGSALPSMITGYEDQRWGFSIGSSSVIGEALGHEDVVFYEGAERPQSTQGSLQYARRWNEKWQSGFVSGKKGKYLQDTELSLTGAFLERIDFDTRQWLGLGFSRVSIPTGHSVYELKANETLADVSGAGFLQWGVGAVFQRTWKHFDFLEMFEVSKMFSVKSSTEDLEPGFRYSFYTAMGYSVLDDHRVGVGLRALYTDAKKNKKTGEVSASNYYFPMDFSYTWFQDAIHSWGLSYTDETLLGPVKNTSLSRTLSGQYSLRF